MSDLFGLEEEVIEEQAEQGEDKVIQMRKPHSEWTVGDTTYKLKLTTTDIVKLEQKYKTNIMNLVAGDIPPLSIMLTIIQAATTKYEHGISIVKVQKIYEAYAEDGGSQMALLTDVIMPLMAVSGFFTPDQAAEMMESLKEQI